jgi:hypothetical protein
MHTESARLYRSTGAAVGQLVIATVGKAAVELPGSADPPHLRCDGTAYNWQRKRSNTRDSISCIKRLRWSLIPTMVWGVDKNLDETAIDFRHYLHLQSR